MCLLVQLGRGANPILSRAARDFQPAARVLFRVAARTNANSRYPREDYVYRFKDVGRGSAVGSGLEEKGREGVGVRSVVQRNTARTAQEVRK